MKTRFFLALARIAGDWSQSGPLAPTAHEARERMLAMHPKLAPENMRVYPITIDNDNTPCPICQRHKWVTQAACWQCGGTGYL